MVSVSDKFKMLEVAIPSDAVEPVDAAIQALNDRFNADDFRVTRNLQQLEVWLRQVSLNELREATNSVATDSFSGDAMQRVFEAVESIRSYGVNGKKRLYVGYNDERKVVGRKKKESRRGKHYYANDHTFLRDARPLPKAYQDRIICGDSETVLKKLPDNCVDLVFTSPPYNFGLGYGDSADADSTDWESYFDKLFAVFDECVRVLKYGGRIIVNVQPLFSDYIPSHHIISNYFIRRRLIWKGEILWEKNNYNCKYTAWGSWKSPSSPYLKYTWEFLEVFCKGELKKPGASSNADISAEQFKQWVTAKWSIAPERNMRSFGHPAMFPEELARRALLLFSFRNDVVLDPFNGVGTTTAVAQQLGRSYFGIDVDTDYCETAQRRLVGTQARWL